jgi:bifunctional DNA-binding transcriptional regulator/antitoxin component of YhaV-PrlF toxin-antitoxin module
VIRKRLKISPATEVDFVVGEDGRVYLTKKDDPSNRQRFAKLRGVATVKMSTEEIMALTRGEP